MAATISALPPELLLQIISYLDARSLAAFTSTSKPIRPFFYPLKRRTATILINRANGTLLGSRDLQTLLSCENLRPYIHEMDIIDVEKPAARPDEGPNIESISLDLQRTSDQLSAAHCSNIAKHVLNIKSKGEGLDAIFWYIRIILALLRSVTSITITPSAFVRLNLPVLHPQQVELAQSQPTKAIQAPDTRSDAEGRLSTACDHPGNCTVDLPALCTVRFHDGCWNISPGQFEAAAGKVLRTQPLLEALSFRNMDLSLPSDVGGVLPPRLKRLHLSHLGIGKTISRAFLCHARS
ncbi:uncharacterized protein B0I36DRAFT_166979 [Microdochium trichocladiopsis]|uniref:F-box domain-containing protein n=1 Tax=Microdochium trichocladiopsis TaxID=1682393 RepID=A0A9P8Y043_9PEZI|nr:uncharacterized protein B0I36DRAFT_166979 [Microdochium trichocladiopsis]KAH7025230.1 hypothetical protein B0I36DRAFT_166979 [Microdochium trichocladiopsis]